MIINVTQEDIDQGSCGDRTNCAVARALRRHAPAESFISVDEIVMIIAPRGAKDKLIETPKEVEEFITAFDKDPGSVKPFSFEIPLEDLCA